MPAASDLADLVQRLSAPRVVWLMLPSGEVTENAVQVLATNLGEGESYTIPGTSITVSVTAITDTSASVYATI